MSRANNINPEQSWTDWFKKNPIALVCGSLLIVPGMILGQIAGLAISLPYAPFIAILGGACSSLIGYSLTSSLDISSKNFYKYVALALSAVLGALWGGLVLASVLFFNAAFLSTQLALIIGICAGITIISGITWLLMELFDVNNSTVINLFSFAIIGMTLLGGLGLAGGPTLWMALLNIGILAGAVIGVMVSYLNNNTEAAKILSSLCSTSGVMAGAMLGVLVGSFIPFLSSAYIGVFFGVVLMSAGALLGNALGCDYHEFDLNNEDLSHKILLASMLLPVLFMGYLGGGVLGFVFLPLGEIIISQALGTVVTGSIYGLVLTTYYLFANYVRIPTLEDFTDGVGEVFHNLIIGTDSTPAQIPTLDKKQEATHESTQGEYLGSPRGPALTRLAQTAVVHEGGAQVGSSADSSSALAKPF